MVSKYQGEPGVAATLYNVSMGDGDYVAALHALEAIAQGSPQPAQQGSAQVAYLRPPLSAGQVASVVDAVSTADALYELGAAIWALDGYELLAVDVLAVAGARGSEDAVVATGEALEWLGASDRAIPWLESAIVARPERAPWLGGLLGEALLARDGVDDRVVQLLADAAAVHVEFGVSYAKALRARGEIQQARAVLTALVGTGVYGAALQLGNLLWDEDDDVVGAESAYRAGVATRDGHSAFNLGLLLRASGHRREATEAFAEALRLGDLTVPPDDGVPI